MFDPDGLDRATDKIHDHLEANGINVENLIKAFSSILETREDAHHLKIKCLAFLGRPSTGITSIKKIGCNLPLKISTSIIRVQKQPRIFMRVSVHLSVCTSVCPSIPPAFANAFFNAPLHLYERVCPSVCWSVRLLVCPSVCPSV